MPDNYSFLDGFIAGSAKPYSLEDLQSYDTDGIRHIVSLTPKLPLVSRYYEGQTLQFHHFPVYATPDQAQIDDFIALIHDARTNGEKVVVHCEFGQERTGIFLASYLVRVKGWTVQRAISTIREERPGSLQTSHARKFLLQLFD